MWFVIPFFFLFLWKLLNLFKTIKSCFFRKYFKSSMALFVVLVLNKFLRQHFQINKDILKNFECIHIWYQILLDINVLPSCIYSSGNLRCSKVPPTLFDNFRVFISDQNPVCVYVFRLRNFLKCLWSKESPIQFVNWKDVVSWTSSYFFYCALKLQKTSFCQENYMLISAGGKVAPPLKKSQLWRSFFFTGNILNFWKKFFF